MYEAYEETSSIGVGETNTVLSNVTSEYGIEVKPGYDYSNLDDNGLIKEGEQMNDKKVVIGSVSFSEEDPETVVDSSIFPKKGQLGVVDKTYVTQDVVGKRISKVRIREQRIPNIGDKFCSRCGQKGTIGTIVPEADMPFTKDGLKPDIIINPHAIPSRMTIGQLIESLMGKLGLNLGSFMDSTPFTTETSKIQQVQHQLTLNGFHSSGNEHLYNGMTGEMIEHSVFIGPTYYMRLKHMVKDKINYRSKGPRTLLTRQTNHGRANDGGLRIGEMERDGVIGHGCSYFLSDSLMNRGDRYRIAVCNHSGTIAIYDKKNKHFFSPMLDGPIIYDMDETDSTSGMKISQFGKKFSIIDVPYCFKLLLQELSCMNIQLRLITNENVHEMNVGTEQKISEMFKTTKIQKQFVGSSEKKPEEIKIITKQPDTNIIYPPGLILWNEESDTDGNGNVIKLYYSIIRDIEDNPTEKYFADDEKLDGQPPNFFPKGWDSDFVKNHNIDPVRLSESLKQRQIANNWNIITNYMMTNKSDKSSKYENGGKPEDEEDEEEYEDFEWNGVDYLIDQDNFLLGVDEKTDDIIKLGTLDPVSRIPIFYSHLDKGEITLDEWKKLAANGDDYLPENNNSPKFTVFDNDKSSSTSDIIGIGETNDVEETKGDNNDGDNGIKIIKIDNDAKETTE
jgi:hypothetical protein